MFQIRYSIISFHWRAKHIFGLVFLAILILSVQFFLSSISLGESNYVNNNFSKSIIEIIGLIFVLYFGSNTRHNFLKSKILYLFRSKKQSASSIIGGLISGLISIIVIYTSITYLFVVIISGASISHLMSRLGTIIILSTMTTITIMLSLVSSSYIALMSSAIIYFVSYSINFILISIQYQSTGKIFASLLPIIQFILPRFDLLSSPLLPINHRIRGFFGHILITSVLYYITIKLFSSRYIHHENILNLGHQSKKE